MPISRRPDHNPKQGRRHFLIGLTGATATLLTGCSLLRNENELAATAADLDKLLQQAPPSQTDQLREIGERLQSQAQLLLQTHRDFLQAFNHLAIARETSIDQLQELAGSYQQQRLVHRQALLQLQDELHQQVPSAMWPEVSALLYRKSRSVSARNLGVI